MIKWITIQLMKYWLKRAKKHHSKETNTIVKQSYSNLIRNYKNTIVYLEAQKR